MTVGWPRLVRVCLWCATSIVQRGHPYCECCWRRLRETFAAKREIEELGLRVISLFEWGPSGENVLRQMLEAFKGGRNSSMLPLLVDELSRSIAAPKGQRLIVIPAPPRVLGKIDHAARWGLEISRWWGAVYAPVLERTDEGHQRQNRRDQRVEKALRLSQAGGRVWRDLKVTELDTVIFADDVVTTGATARAAQAALTPSGHFEVWSIAHRTRLRSRP